MNLISRKAIKELQSLKGMIAKRRSPLAGMTEQEVIEKLRKDRERLWESKFAAHS